MVLQSDIVTALHTLGIGQNDTVLVHSSLKSFGTVNSGAKTVISAFQETLGNGTLLMPALRQREFHNAYKDWNIHTTPSDVGLITETFRTTPGVLRSNCPTHSVCAWGKRAAFFTDGHGDFHPRIGPFGDTPFSTTSAWQHIYEENVSIVMLGVTLVYNTLKHFVEYTLVDNILQSLPENERAEAAAPLTRFGDTNGKFWFYHDGLKTQEKLEQLGMVSHARCGNCELIKIEAKPFVDFMYSEFLEHPEQWFYPQAAEWIVTYRGGIYHGH